MQYVVRKKELCMVCFYRLLHALFSFISSGLLWTPNLSLQVASEPWIGMHIHFADHCCLSKFWEPWFFHGEWGLALLVLSSLPLSRSDFNGKLVSFWNSETAILNLSIEKSKYELGYLLVCLMCGIILEVMWAQGIVTDSSKFYFCFLQELLVIVWHTKVWWTA